MSGLVLYFHVHQPYRLKEYPMFAIGRDKDYFRSMNEKLDNKRLLLKVAEKCYLPGNKVLLDLLREHHDFRVTFSISGSVLEQFEEFAPDVIESFKRLVDTGQVELLAETYYHSLAFVYSKDEFKRQVKRHGDKVKKVFGVRPRAFRNTELVFNNEVAKAAQEMGFKAVLAEGVDRYLKGRSPNFVYKSKGADKIGLLLKNYRLSDDVAFRFSDQDWDGWPLTAEKFAFWVGEAVKEAQVVNLFMDYETFGEHHWGDTGIFEFLINLPGQVKRSGAAQFLTVSEAVDKYEPTDEIDMPELTSWADEERDLSAWLGNPMQQEAARAVFELEGEVLASGDGRLIEDWGRLTTSDHLYYMSTKALNDGQVHKYFSPNESPYEAFKNYMNVVRDLKQRVESI